MHSLCADVFIATSSRILYTECGVADTTTLGLSEEYTQPRISAHTHVILSAHTRVLNYQGY